MTSAEWKIEWDNAIEELMRISKDLDLKSSANDKDRIELSDSRYEDALRHVNFCESMYWKTLDEENSGTAKRRLNSLGRSDYGY